MIRANRVIRANRKFELFVRTGLTCYRNRGFNCEWFARIDSRESRCESPVPLSTRELFPNYLCNHFGPHSMSCIVGTDQSPPCQVMSLCQVCGVNTVWKLWCLLGRHLCRVNLFARKGEFWRWILGWKFEASFPWWSMDRKIHPLINRPHNPQQKLAPFFYKSPKLMLRCPVGWVWDCQATRSAPLAKVSWNAWIEHDSVIWQLAS